MEVLDQETKILDFGFHLSIIRSMHCRRKDFGSRDPKGVKWRNIDETSRYPIKELEFEVEGVKELEVLRWNIQHFWRILLGVFPEILSRTVLQSRIVYKV